MTRAAAAAAYPYIVSISLFSLESLIRVHCASGTLITSSYKLALEAKPDHSVDRRSSQCCRTVSQSPIQHSNEQMTDESLSGSQEQEYYDRLFTVIDKMDVSGLALDVWQAVGS
jgi:hypothetical protein